MKTKVRGLLSVPVCIGLVAGFFAGVFAAGLFDFGGSGSAAQREFFLGGTATSSEEGVLIDRDIAALEAQEFLRRQEASQIFYRPLREDVQTVIALHPNRKVSYYFEDLLTGAWVGIDEREAFIPASLAKIPTLAAVFKKIEIDDKNLSLETKLPIEPQDFDPRSGVIRKEDVGTEKSIAELSVLFLGASDNTAGWTLKRLLSEADIIEARVAMGVPPLDVPNATISPKVYSNILRSLYKSTYLSRELSNFILATLSESIYPDGLRAGVPASVKVANKVGAFSQLGAYHDCGIIYHPSRPYFICVMTQGFESYDEANKVISAISQVTYSHIQGGSSGLIPAQ